MLRQRVQSCFQALLAHIRPILNHQSMLMAFSAASGGKRIFLGHQFVLLLSRPLPLAALN
jgi:hypothetical protein